MQTRGFGKHSFTLWARGPAWCWPMLPRFLEIWSERGHSLVEKGGTPVAIISAMQAGLLSYYAKAAAWAWHTIWSFALDRVLWAVPVAMAAALILAIAQRARFGKWRGTWISGLVGAIGGPAVVIAAGVIVNLVRYPPVHEAELLSQLPKVVPKTVTFQWLNNDHFLSDDDVFWIRVDAKNIGANDLALCIVDINKIRKERESEVLYSGDGLQLSWEGGPLEVKDNIARTIPAGQTRTFNIAFVEKSGE
jgi:hypothetical protein